MFQFFLWIIYIGNFRTFWHRKLTVFLPNFWVNSFLIPPGPRIPQWAKCPNTSKLYTARECYKNLSDDEKQKFVEYRKKYRIRKKNALLQL